MKCTACGGEFGAPRRGLHKYVESGLDYVWLSGVEIRACKGCEGRRVSLPKLAELHRVIAKALSTAPVRLGGRELRFLRTFLGWSRTDAATLLGMSPTTISRWEGESRGLPPTVDHLLRVLAMQHAADPGTTPLSEQESVIKKAQAEGKKRPERVKFTASEGRGWLAEPVG